jgi:NitT/TauT family transport system substrate-binding protein
MTSQRIRQEPIVKRRDCLIGGGAGALALGLSVRPAAAAIATVRQGYQTNIWGMPTYYLLQSGYLAKHEIAATDFAVPSGNLTMQQMVARQVDLGTYAGQSFIIGNAKGGLVAIAVIEHVGKTARITARKDLNISKVEELRGRRIANQTGSSVGNVFVDTIMPQHGLKKGDYVEVRMDVNNMVAALAAKMVDAMVNVEPYNVIAVADGIGTDLMDFSAVDPMPVFMAATPDFVQSKPDVVIAYLKAWLDVANDFKNDPQKVANVIYKFYADKGYNMSLDTFTKALARVEVNPGFPADLQPYMQQQAEILLADKKISAIPDWKTALRPDFMERARTAS